MGSWTTITTALRGQPIIPAPRVIANRLVVFYIAADDAGVTIFRRELGTLIFARRSFPSTPLGYHFALAANFRVLRRARALVRELVQRAAMVPSASVLERIETTTALQLSAYWLRRSTGRGAIPAPIRIRKFETGCVNFPALTRLRDSVHVNTFW